MPQTLSDTLTLAALMDAPQSGHPLFTYDAKAQKYFYKGSKKPVSKAAFEKLTNDHILRKKAELRKIGDRFTEKGGFVFFQKDGWKTVKTTFAQQYILGRGGVGKMADSDYATLKKELRYQSKMWRGFAVDIKAGNVSSAQMQMRLGMYGEASKVAFFDGQTAAAIAAGMTEELNVMNSALENCEGCIERTNRGWQPIGTLGRITKGTPCMVHCGCGRKTRKGKKRSDAVKMDKPCGAGFIKDEYHCGKNPSGQSHKKMIERGEQIVLEDGQSLLQASNAFDRLSEIENRIKQGEDGLESTFLEAKKAAKASFEKVQDFRDSLMSRSDPDVDGFFDGLTIERSVKTALRDSKLGGDKLAESLEETYLMTNGKLKPGLHIDSTDLGVASAAIDTRMRTMYLNSDFEPEPEDIFHELGHLLERDHPPIHEAAYDFLLERADGNKIDLSTLTKVKGHKGTKVYPDSFVDPYVGLVYPGTRDTEITSVGLQHFSSAYNMVYLYKQDPAHFHLIVGMLND
jgi:hypothetical protein